MADGLYGGRDFLLILFIKSQHLEKQFLQIGGVPWSFRELTLKRQRK